MKVFELIEWLNQFPDQEADVLIVEHSDGTGYYDQGGNAYEEEFNPEKHAEYIDMHGNPYVTPDKSYYNKRTLLLGAMHT